MIKGFSHIYVPALDLDESIKFYTEKLGFDLFRRWTPAPGRQGARPGPVGNAPALRRRILAGRRCLPARPRLPPPAPPGQMHG